MIGLYQHFKGAYYYVQNVAINADSGEKSCYYFNIFNPEMGMFVRPVSEWFDDVSDREDNVTGQTTRFKKIKSIDTSVRNLTTEELIKELRERSDSPLQEVDFEGFNDKVVYRDFIVGHFYPKTDENDEGVFTFNSFDSKEEAIKYLHTNYLPQNGHKVYKRTFLKVE